MPWQLTDSIDEYDAHASPLLESRPDENTVALTVLADLKSGRKWSDEPPMLGWYTDEHGRIIGAVSMTPPYELLLAEVPLDTVDELVEAIRARGERPSGVNGLPELVEAFAKRWTGGTHEVHMQQRLYTLGGLRLPSSTSGRARPVRVDELDTYEELVGAFIKEVDGLHVRNDAALRKRVEAQRVWFWEDDSGAVVSTAAHTQAVVGVARVGPVYTPPEHRRNGYGAAVTAVATQHALDEGATRAVLFTDLSNPTSNAIYQQIGYRPLSDRMVVRFSD